MFDLKSRADNTCPLAFPIGLAHKGQDNVRTIAAKWLVCCAHFVLERSGYMLEKIEYEYYESVDSTNERIKERARQGAKEGLTISAMQQTAGRGRIGRKWESPPNECVATSMLLYQGDIPRAAIPSITILCGLAVRSALHKLYGLECQIKWPNDIVVHGKKLCGILVEYETLSNGESYLILGIGVNVHQHFFLEEIADKATSVELEVDKKYEKHIHRKEIVEEIWKSFLEYFNQFVVYYNLCCFKEEYEKYLVNKGERVRIENPHNTYEAIALGISGSGGLLVEINGEQKEIKNFEVSVRGMYGYV